MFEQTSRLAEKLAASVSRRGFLDSLGGWAAATAMGVAGVLMGAGTAWAGPQLNTWCIYTTPCSSAPIVCRGVTIPCPYACLCVATAQDCPATYPGTNYTLLSAVTQNGCKQCC
jgi:hypothetical protein